MAWRDPQPMEDDMLPKPKRLRVQLLISTNLTNLKSARPKDNDNVHLLFLLVASLHLFLLSYDHLLLLIQVLLLLVHLLLFEHLLLLLFKHLLLLVHLLLVLIFHTIGHLGVGTEPIIGLLLVLIRLIRTVN